MFEGRLEKLNDLSDNTKGKYVLYSMEASIREDFNFSLEFAVERANKLNKPLIVSFFITDKYRYSNQRYYRFMIEGVLKTKKAIEERGIKFVIQKDDFVNGTLKLSKNAVCIVLDKNYLKTQRIWRERIAQNSQVAVYQLENDVVVPIKLVADRPIPYAYLYRDRINRLIDRFLKPVEKLDLKVKSLDLDIESMEFDSVDGFLSILNIDKTVQTVEKYYVGGYEEAEKRLREFIEKKLFRYKELRSDPSKDYTSNLSPYLHFGQISPLRIVLEVLRHYDRRDENVASFLNELIVWRELARNFCWYNPLYNQYEGIPDWAIKTLEEHKKDKRDYLYSLQEFEEARTHDPYWNAAQMELLKTGKIHNYMRMYWAKKIIEWTENPKQAFDIACYLNDKYALDGRDPNGYAGISWCFGSFDRPWRERKIFGKVRYMNDKGLERKFDMKSYLLKVNLL